MKFLIVITFLLALTIYCFAIDKLQIDTSQTLVSYRVLDRLSINSVSNPDSAISIVKSYHHRALANKDTVRIIEALMSLSDIHRVNENYSASFDFGGEALFMAEQFKDSFLLSEAYSKYGILNYLFYQKGDALKYLNKAVQLSKRLKKNRQSSSQLRSKYFNLALAHRHFNDYETALVYLDSCYLINREKRGSLYLDSEKGIILLHQKKHKEALKELIKAANQFEDIDAANDYDNAKGYLLVIYAYIAEVYHGMGNREMAQLYFNKSYLALENNKRYMSHKASIMEKFGLFQYSIGEYKQAFEKLQEAYRLNERHFSTKTISNNDFITTRNKYQENIVLKDNELAHKNLLIATQKQQMLKVRVILYSGILLTLIVIVVFISRFKILKQKRALLVIAEKQRESKVQLELKNKELTASTLRLIEKEEVITSLTDHLKSFPNNQQTDALLVSINSSSSSLWEDFNSRFMAVNKGFYEKLNKEIPGLSPGDLKICALIKLNFTGKEMAHLLGISVDSVHKARHRLRKKMNLDRDVNLTIYISSI